MSATRTFILRDTAVTGRALAFIANLPLDPLWEISCRPYKAKRSLDANSLYWVRMQEIGNALGYGPDEMHEVFKAMFLPPVTIDLGTEQRVVSGSSAKLKVKAFSEYLERVEAWASANGIHLSNQPENGK